MVFAMLLICSLIHLKNEVSTFKHLIYSPTLVSMTSGARQTSLVDNDPKSHESLAVVHASPDKRLFVCRPNSL